MAFPRKEAQNPFFRTLLLNFIVFGTNKKVFYWFMRVRNIMRTD